MGQKTIKIGVEVDRETDETVEDWADDEGRSKRRHAAVLLRKLAKLKKTQPGELIKLGLLDRPAAVAH